MTPLDSERDIIIRLKNGDQKAMAPIFKLYHKSLCYFARQLVDNDGQAEDIVADAFIKLWQKNTDFENLASIRAFMYVTIRNSCCNYLKHIHRRTASHQKILYTSQKYTDCIEGSFIKSELFRLALREADSLPPGRRRIFKMIYEEGLPTNEICQRLGIDINTVRVQKARALAFIKSIIIAKVNTINYPKKEDEVGKSNPSNTIIGKTETVLYCSIGQHVQNEYTSYINSAGRRICKLCNSTDNNLDSSIPPGKFVVIDGQRYCRNMHLQTSKTTCTYTYSDGRVQEFCKKCKSEQRKNKATRDRILNASD